MMLRTALAAFSALLIGSLAEARAEMACSTYSRGAQLEDEVVIQQATEFAMPLITAKWHSMAMLDDIPNVTSANDMEPVLVLRQLARDCRALPDDTVEAIVATHLKSQRAQEAAAAEAKRAELQRQEEYERPFRQRDDEIAAAEAHAAPLPSPLRATQLGISNISCATYLKYDETHPSTIYHAFSVVFQRLYDADPVASRGHIHFEGAAQNSEATEYCLDHLDGNLGDALKHYLNVARGQ